MKNLEEFRKLQKNNVAGLQTILRKFYIYLKFFCQFLDSYYCSILLKGIGKTSLLEQLRQEGIYRKRPHEHWAKRMGNKNINLKTAKGTNMSTVGVDIGVWVFEKKNKRAKF